MSACCSAPQQEASVSIRRSCPSCMGRGRAVESITLKALLRPDALSRLEGADYEFCPNPSCPIVYFSPGAFYRKEDLKIRVGLKETDSPLPVCYCFGHTRESVWEEIRRTGRSTAAQTIATHVKAGRCGCEVNNPSGSCCLGEVNRAAQEGLARIAPANPETLPTFFQDAEEDCCASGH